MSAKAILRIHKDIWLNTDHGHTWVECAWFEQDGKRITATFSVAGACERLPHLPGGPIPLPDYPAEVAIHGITEWDTVKSESMHAGYYSVGPISITRKG